MGCFLVPAAEAIVTTVVTKIVEKKEAATDNAAPAGAANSEAVAAVKIPFSRKLKWLRSLLWGGVVLLLFEHIWHGEVVPWFPFLTAMSDPEDASAMLREMSTVGVTMAVIVTLVWVGMLIVSSMVEKQASKAPAKI
ncbi:MAG: hypothetical protein J6Y10_01400 [Lachnospiraceae bacterium]|nr:hypothetical protein [Lachnospiraceae bacterium]